MEGKGRRVSNIGGRRRRELLDRLSDRHGGARAWGGLTRDSSSFLSHRLPVLAVSGAQASGRIMKRGKGTRVQPPIRVGFLPRLVTRPCNGSGVKPPHPPTNKDMGRYLRLNRWRNLAGGYGTPYATGVGLCSGPLAVKNRSDNRKTRGTGGAASVMPRHDVRTRQRSATGLKRVAL